jgi:SAM-dependent methyltransferase
MSMEFGRRKFIRYAALGVAAFYSRYSFGAKAPSVLPFVAGNATPDPGNFKAIFGDSATRAEFLDFLENVYHIYPHREFHALISKLVSEHATDREIYSAILRDLGKIKPILSELTYALPALARQKQEIADQTMELLGDRREINGYLEIGTPGRYISELKDRIAFRGDVALLNVTEPSFSPLDIVERGQLSRIGRYIPLDDYAEFAPAHAAEGAYEVVTNYIGFHHSTLECLEGFVQSVRRSLKPGGTLILRDHDVIDARMNHLVALAHDVFNAGLENPWDYNHQEVRHFRPVAEWITYLKANGFEYRGRQIYQKGDPTRNALMAFQRS